VFGLTGPSFAVGGGLHAAVEALAIGALLVESGDAERMLVVGVDEAGPVSRALFGDQIGSGAVAVLLSAEARHARARVRSVVLRRGGGWVGPSAPAGHRALLPLAGPIAPGSVESASPPDAFAQVVLQSL
jgi:hypothetical protein